MTWVAVSLAVHAAIQGEKARREGNKQRKRDKIEDDKLMAEQKGRQQKLDAFGQPLLQQGQQNMESVQDYLRRLSSGDRGLTEQAMAPNINAMTDQFRGSVSAQRSMNPRGSNAAQSGMLNQQLNSGVNNMLFGARTGAMDSLSQLGSNQATLGLSAMGQGAGLTNSMLQYGLNARGQMFNQGMMAGQASGGYAAGLQGIYNAWPRNNSLPASNPSPYTSSMQPNQIGGNLDTFGKGSTLGFGGQTPGSTYSPSNNPYGGKP